MAQNSSFEVSTSTDNPSGSTLLIGLSTVGLAGLTAVDYLIKQHNPTEIGHITTQNIPDITPFEEGEPRLPVRIYDLPDLDLTILIGELFIPVWAADPFAETLLDWVSSTEIDEITVLHGTPFPHGPDEHNAFYVASSSYKDQLTNSGIAPLAGGYLDGVASELMTSSLTGTVPPIGVFITPTHPPGPDFDAALLFLETLEDIYDFTIEEQELEKRAEEMNQYYDELATRMQQFERSDQPLQSRDFPEDRMFM